MLSSIDWPAVFVKNQFLFFNDLSLNFNLTHLLQLPIQWRDLLEIYYTSADSS